MMPTILVADDDFAFTRVLSDVLSDAGYRTLVAEDGPRALQVVRAPRPALVLLDLMLPGMSAAAVLAEIRSDADPTLAVIILSANPAARALLRDGASAVLIKPFHWDALLACVAELVPYPVERVA
jgi:CheY-like chemotaxis protein